MRKVPLTTCSIAKFGVHTIEKGQESVSGENSNFFPEKRCLRLAIHQNAIPDFFIKGVSSDPRWPKSKPRLWF